MPIQLDDISSIAASLNANVSATPKYFHKDLTGDGQRVAGIFGANNHPGRYPLGHSKHTMPRTGLDKKSKTSGNSVTTRVFPMGILTCESILQSIATGATLPLPDKDEMFFVTDGRSKVPFDVYMNLTPQSFVLREDDSGDKRSRTTEMLYRMEVYVLDKASTATRIPLTNRAAAQGDFVMVDWSFAPLDDIEDLIDSATLHAHGPNLAGGVYVDMNDVATWMGDYNVFDHVAALAQIWSSDDIAEEISIHLAELFKHGVPNEQAQMALGRQLRGLEAYSVPLSAYSKIHSQLNAVCPQDVALSLSKQNLNLLMNHTLDELRSIQPRLTRPVLPQGVTDGLPAFFSQQQRNAITTDAPLALARAGAGTGKTTVIGGRIGYLGRCGVDMHDITVLSFTNAAADNVKDRFPEVGSMTIARMIHDIYSLNYPTHELSSIDTILNSLDIFYPNSELAAAMRRLLRDVHKNAAGSTTALNAFIEKYFDDVIEVLNTLRQTCLEMEIIIAYQRIDHMAEPAHVQSRFLIIDEVQDNSIFEFIYMLKYVAKHEENMFLVGDAAQTLFEFRASNPRALNALETSGVFECFELTTNYRSNQEVLDFANVHLADIEANQAAQIRLQANSLVAPTSASFQERVSLKYIHGRTFSEFDKNFEAYMLNIIKPYVDTCLARGEQIALLSHTRDKVAQMEKFLNAMYPSLHVANLVSEKTWSSTVFSQFIKMYWEDIKQVPQVGNAALAVHKGIDANLDKLTNKADVSKLRPAVINMISKWWTENNPTIQGWVNLAGIGQMTKDEFFDNLRQNLLDYEIAHNSIKQSLTNQRNRERKEKNLQSNSPLLVSTIHGAKGLEFDNVVVIHKFDSQMNEADKRMHYVAFTRAKNTELIVSYGTVKKPRITSDYELMVEALNKRDDVAALRKQGIDIDNMSEDEIIDALVVYRDQQAAAGAPEKPVPDFSVPGVDDASASSTQGKGSGSKPADDGSAFTG